MKTATAHAASIGLRPGRRAGFTLVELMVVIGVIALLITIVVPAVSNARKMAKVAATKATVSVLDSGLEQYRASDRLEGTYPPSTVGTGNFAVPSPHQVNGNSVQARVYGAQLLAWALVGADLMGTPGFRDVDNTTPTALNSPAWGNDTGTLYNTSSPPLSNLYAVFPSTGKPVHARQGPFVDVSKMSFPTRKSGTTIKFELPSFPRSNSLDTICFLDTFGQPILYYRAKTVGQYPATFSNYGSDADGVYNLRDNTWFTGSPSGAAQVDFGAGFLTHPMGTLGTQNNPSADTKSFSRTVWNPAAVGAVPRPHNAEKFILISAGPDGLYGTSDDVANFPVNQ